MKIRIPITSDNSTVIPRDPFLISLTDRADPSDTSDRHDPVNPDDLDKPDNPGDSGGTGDSGSSDNSDPYANLPEYALPELSVRIDPVCPDGYDSNRTDYPANYVRVSVPDDDIPVVRSWFAVTPGGGGLPSDTLVSRMTKAVIGSLKSFYEDCDMESLFSRPFRLGYALRLADGRHYSHGQIRLVLPSDRAPLLPVRSREFSNNIFRALTEFHIHPGNLTVSMDPFTLPERLDALATHIDFYATRQIDTITGDETVSGIATESVDGANTPVWQYPRRSADVLKSKAEADTEFRIIGSIPVADARNGIESIILPTGNRNLLDWTAFDKLKADPQPDPQPDPDKPTDPDTPTDPDGEGTDTPATDPENPATRYRNKIVEIGPLDLGYPEHRKYVRGLSVRGVFERLVEGAEIRVTLYGSHHRDRWHRVAASRGPHIRLLRTVGYRWYKLAVRSAYGATLDAVTFDVLLQPER